MGAPNTDSKLILASGSDTGMGTTCIMNYVALELAKKGTVLLIEFKRKTGFSIYMHRGHHERRRSLTEVINIPERLSENVIRSPHSTNMFYLCMNLYEDSLKLQEYQSFKVIDIIKEAKRVFDYVILDLPADPSEPAVGVTFGKDFIYKPDHTILFVDERVSSFKYLNDFNAILAVAGETSPRDVTFVINKVATSHYQDYIEDYLPSLPLTKPTNKVWLPFLPDLITATNKGKIYETGINKVSKMFFRQVDELASIIYEDKRGVNLTKKTMDKLMEVEDGEGLFGKLFKKKVDKLETQEEKAEHNRRVDEAFNKSEETEFSSIEEKYQFVSDELTNADIDWMDGNDMDDMVLIPATQDQPYQPTDQHQYQYQDDMGYEQQYQDDMGHDLNYQYPDNNNNLNRKNKTGKSKKNSGMFGGSSKSKSKSKKKPKAKSKKKPTEKSNKKKMRR